MYFVNNPLGGFGTLVRSALFRLDPEIAHGAAIRALSAGGPVVRRMGLQVRDPRLEQRVWGVRFPTPIGLAAGYDKSGSAIPGWCQMGFGFAEIGTVTAQPQPGNPTPRLFRLPEDRAIINRMGFNNDGAAATAARLAQLARVGRLHGIPLGINIGKSKVTPLEEAAADYCFSLDRLWPYADYIVVNVSSPNTPGLRELQEASHLAGILDELLDLNRTKATLTGRHRARPVLVKVAPDLTDEQLDAVVDLVRSVGADGLIVSNTTLSRDGLRSPASLVAEAGGLSGPPVAARSLEMLHRCLSRAPELPVISVGGISTVDDVWERLAAGARLVQIWTALVYEGPLLVSRLTRGVLQRLEDAGLTVPELNGSARG